MLEKLYLSNLSLNVSEDILADMFGQFGVLHEVAVLINQRTGEPRYAARVTMEIDSEETMLEMSRAFNGYELDGQPVYLTLYAPPEPRAYTEQERADTAMICKLLGETEQQPRYQLLRLRRICLMPFMEAMYQETLRVEAEGGIMTMDESRRRTVGGVFFHLCRRYLAVRVRRSIFVNKKLVEEQRKRKEEAKALKAEEAARRAAEKKERQAAKQAARQNKPPKQKQAAPDSPALAAAREKLADLNAKFEAAQRELDELKAKPREEQKTGLFSATRNVVNIQREIAVLLKEFPKLNKK